MLPTFDLFGELRSPQKQIELTVFHDERMVSDWLYHAFLIVPNNELEEFKKRLADLRVKAECEPTKRVHFYQLTAHSTTSTRTMCAKLWAQAYRSEFFTRSCFYILGVDLTKIDHGFFGDEDSTRSEEDFRIYNRFFEVGLFGALRFFYWDYDKRVTAIHTEKRDREIHDPFLRHPVYAINRRESNMEILCPKIEEISPDPAIETQRRDLTDVLQYVDVIIGAHSQNLDYSSKTKTGCNEVADVLLPITDRLVRNPRNRNSRYYRRYSLSFFPRQKISPNDIDLKVATQFYNERYIKRMEKFQPRLME